MNLKKYKKIFPVTKDSVYLNHAAVSPLLGLRWEWESGTQPARVVQAQAELDALVHKASFARMGIPFQVREQYLSMQAKHKSIESMKKSSKSARRWMIAAYSDFEAGLEEADSIFSALQVYVITVTAAKVLAVRHQAGRFLPVHTDEVAAKPGQCGVIRVSRNGPPGPDTRFVRTDPRFPDGAAGFAALIPVEESVQGDRLACGRGDLEPQQVSMERVVDRHAGFEPQLIYLMGDDRVSAW